MFLLSIVSYYESEYWTTYNFGGPFQVMDFNSDDEDSFYRESSSDYDDGEDTDREEHLAAVYRGEEEPSGDEDEDEGKDEDEDKDDSDEDYSENGEN